MELKGHSGCRLCIISENGVKSVKKYSSSKSYNERLKRQMKKQETLNLKGFDRCKVHTCGYENGLFYFTMDYLNGKTLADYMPYIELNRISEITDMLCLNMEKFEKPNNEANRIFEHKLASIAIDKEKMKTDFVREAMGILNDFSWKYVIPGMCHGDMTLENIIVQGEELLLIDCLDSFYDSWMIDAAKVLQDVDLMWSYRGVQNMDNNLIIRLTVMRDLLIEKIGSMNEGEKLLETIYHLLLLNVLRIYPYTHDSVTEMFLDSKVKYILKKIKAKGWR